MSAEHLSGFLQWLKGQLASESLATAPDNQLLERFLATQDELVFQVIISRHGPMVIGYGKHSFKSEMQKMLGILSNCMENRIEFNEWELGEIEVDCEITPTGTWFEILFPHGFEGVLLGHTTLRLEASVFNALFEAMQKTKMPC